MNLENLSDHELEIQWQLRTSMIATALRHYYETEDETYRKLAEREQKKQTEIQEEITRRS